MKIGFDNDKYIALQTKAILGRSKKFSGKLYMEVGGKIFDDMHASRVLPGFLPDAKIKVLQSLKDKCEIVFVISSNDIENHKVRADFSITYDDDLLRQIDSLRNVGLNVSSIVITLYKGQPRAKAFAEKLERMGEKVYIHTPTKGYPNDIATIVSDEGYGANPYIETTKPVVIVTAPGPGSGKLATCLSQLYHENKRGIKAGYAKFETFPIWNLDLKHPVNIAYEAATADLKDINMIDSFHLEAYGKIAVNYNRDLECFPVLQNILTKITGNSKFYMSPTDMGVNMAGFAITDDKVVSEAAKNEIIRRYQKAKVDYKNGTASEDVSTRIEMLMSHMGISVLDRAVVKSAREKYAETKTQLICLELDNGTIVYGKQKALLTSGASVVLNALKSLAEIDDKLELIPQNILLPVKNLKERAFNSAFGQLNLKDALLALAVSSSVNPIAKLALEKLPRLKNCEAHSTCILDKNEEQTLKELGVRITSEAKFASSNLYKA
ncbi:MAG: DUF1846 domain-containing protein [Clostridia bacterium]|nr:DUF1846 domain-containing protein [Clostridia bacterium]